MRQPISPRPNGVQSRPVSEPALIRAACSQPGAPHSADAAGPGGEGRGVGAQLVTRSATSPSQKFGTDTPVSEKQTRITQIIWSDHPAFFMLRPFIAAGARAFLRQDGEMVNLQNQGLRYDPSLLWIDDADRQAKWYQQLKREWAASRREGRAFVNPVEPVTLRWRS